MAAQAPTSVVEVIDVLWTHDGDQLTCSALGPADDAVPLWDTVTVLQITNQNGYLNEQFWFQRTQVNIKSIEKLIFD